MSCSASRRCATSSAEAGASSLAVVVAGCLFAGCDLDAAASSSLMAACNCDKSSPDGAAGCCDSTSCATRAGAGVADSFASAGLDPCKAPPTPAPMTIDNAQTDHNLTMLPPFTDSQSCC